MEMIGGLGLYYIKQKSEVKSEDFPKDQLVYHVPFTQSLLAGFGSWAQHTGPELAQHFYAQGMASSVASREETQGTKEPPASDVYDTEILVESQISFCTIDKESMCESNHQLTKLEKNVQPL